MRARGRERGVGHATGGLHPYLRDPDGNKLCVMHRPPKEAAAK